MSTLHVHVVHPHIEHRNAHGPVKVADQHPTGTALTRFNTRLALFITKVVGSMWCAYAFALFDLISLPAAIRRGGADVRFLGGTDLPATGAVVDHHGRAERTGRRR